MDAQGDVADAFRPVPYGVHACHRGQEGLGGADVRSRLLAFDVLFACLESHAVTQVPVFVLAPTDDAARHVALVLIAGGEVSGRGTSVEEGRAQTLGASEHDVGSPFARRRQQGEAQDVGGYGHLALSFMGFLHKSAIVVQASVCIGILDDAGKEVGGELQFFITSYAEGNALGHDTGAHYGQCLGEDTFVHKDSVGARLLHVAGTQGMHHRDGFGGGSAFVQQRAVGQGHTCQVAYGSLEVHQCLQAALRYFRLVGRIRGVPHGIFEYIALDDSRGDGVIPSLADVRCIDLVLGGQCRDVERELVFVHRFGQVEGVGKANVGRQGLVNQFVQALYAYLAKHRSFVLRIDADVAIIKRMLIHIYIRY